MKPLNSVKSVSAPSVHIGPFQAVPVPTDEPLDRLSPSDIAIINGALHIYYAESRDCLADAKQLQQIRSISRRLADVSLRWVAEEVTE